VIRLKDQTPLVNFEKKAFFFQIVNFESFRLVWPTIKQTDIFVLCLPVLSFRKRDTGEIEIVKSEEQAHKQSVYP